MSKWGPWIEDNPGVCPVDPMTVVRIQRRNGSTVQARARNFDWEIDGSLKEDEIVRFCIHLGEGEPEPTKTLLDEYAMAALTGILAGKTPNTVLAANVAAERAFDCAEALLTERQKREGR